jgi:hypothetical protein
VYEYEVCPLPMIAEYQNTASADDDMQGGDARRLASLDVTLEFQSSCELYGP